MARRWRREKRLTEYPLPTALEQSYERAMKLERGVLLTWAESTCLNADRLIHEYSQNMHPPTIHDAYHHALQLVGMVRALAERSETFDFNSTPT